MSNSSIGNSSFMGYYHFLFTELADPRSHDWFLVTHPVIFPIVGFYLYFVTKLGPRLMQNRPAFELKKTLIVYNAIQVAISIWLFLEALDGAYLSTTNRYNLRCEPVDFSTSPHAMRVLRGVYIFYMAKISELLDTVFFVLRKKTNQLTFLHMYHHTVMPMVGWGVVKYYPGGHGIFVGFINSFVHIIMYTYYMLAAMGPQFQKYLWWKKYITNLQMLQFCIAFLHSSQLLFYDCGYPWWSVFFTMPNAVFFYYLWSDFYRKAYRGASQGQGVQKSVNGKANGSAKNKNKNARSQSETHNGVQNGYHHKTH